MPGYPPASVPPIPRLRPTFTPRECRAPCRRSRTLAVHGWRAATTAFLAALASVALTGCEATSDAPAAITLRYQEREPLTRDRLVMTVDDGRNEWYFEGGDLEPAGDGWLASRPLRLNTNSGVRLMVAFRGDEELSVASGEVFLSSAAHERWQVDIFTSELAPEVACAGCRGVTRFLIADEARPTARDWLYVRWTSTAASPTGP